MKGPGSGPGTSSCICHHACRRDPSMHVTVTPACRSPSGRCLPCIIHVTQTWKPGTLNKLNVQGLLLPVLWRGLRLQQAGGALPLIACMVTPTDPHACIGVFLRTGRNYASTAPQRLSINLACDCAPQEAEFGEPPAKIAITTPLLNGYNSIRLNSRFPMPKQGKVGALVPHFVADVLRNVCFNVCLRVNTRCYHGHARVAANPLLNLQWMTRARVVNAPNILFTYQNT